MTKLLGRNSIAILRMILRMIPKSCPKVAYKNSKILSLDMSKNSVGFSELFSKSLLN